MQEISPSSDRRNAGCAFGIIAFVIVFFVIGSLLQRNAPPVAANNTGTRSDACFMAQKFVRNRLKAPSTAQFPMWTADNCKARNTGGKWIVYSFVDAENGFGAMLRNDYVAEMTYSPARDVWTLTNLAMEGR